MDSSTKSLIFIIGAPGSGKGTLCKKLSEDYGFSHLSVGDLLRQFTSLSNANKNIVDCVHHGELVPVKALMPILRSHIYEEVESGRKTILLDGFPRRLDQAAPVEALVGSPVLVLFFDCPEKVAEQRFLTRKLTGRETDDGQTFRKRYQEFTELNSNIVENYQTKDILLKIDTSGDAEVSYQKLLSALQDTSEWRSLITLA